MAEEKNVVQAAVRDTIHNYLTKFGRKPNYVELQFNVFQELKESRYNSVARFDDGTIMRIYFSDYPCRVREDDAPFIFEGTQIRIYNG